MLDIIHLKRDSWLFPGSTATGRLPRRICRMIGTGGLRYSFGSAIPTLM